MAWFSFISSLFGKKTTDQHAASGGGIIVSGGGTSDGGGGTSDGGGSSSSGDHFSTHLSRNDSTMMRQLQEANKYRSIIEEAARKTNLPVAIICGIGSRESHWGLALKPPGPGGRGDYAKRKARGVRRGLEPNDGGGYGRGLMQIDYDWHEFARTGNWQNARANIMYACSVLNSARRFFTQRNVSEEQMMRAIIAAYNAGATATYTCISGGQDIDCKTTGRDYSADVLSRAGWFQLHGW